jgi:hypothetical protein
VPLPLAFRLEPLLAAGNSLDGTLARLQKLNINRLALHPFEQELLEDAQYGLK